MSESRMAQTSKVQESVSKINALRKLTQETGTVTRRAQSLILRSLNEHELTAVAEILAQQPSEAAHV